MSNPRRTLHVNSSQNPDNPFQTQSNTFFSLNFLKKPHAFPFLLSIFLFLTWVSLRFQNSSHVSSRPLSLQRWNKEDDLKANLVRYLPFQLSKDTRGWLLNPVTAALNAGLSGGAVTCASVHVGEIRPGGIRGNHRHYTCNETFIIWGAQVKFRLENSQVAGKGYAEVIISADEVAVTASPSGTAHALVNMDPVKTAYFL
uniref:Cupin type-1 domain-containing protein n=1 Tax=Opuntia streptacantha TaxID=393608 RepID=A0A7C9DM85_OPUST